LETPRDPVEKRGPLWHQPLPQTPLATVSGAPDEAPGPVSYGDYFNAVHRFLVRDDHRVLKTAVEQIIGENSGFDRPKHIAIFLVKHGEWYHPSRIELELEDRRLDFVLNVALSETGRRRLADEVHCLTRLGGHPAAEYLPAVYGHGEVATASGAILPMWLGQWFGGFHEFHWTDCGTGCTPGLCIWDPRTGKRLLDSNQVGPVYRQAAAILTDFFDLTTFEHIHPWHHAAGDFVVRQQRDRLDVRLITVRGYPALIDPGPRNAVPGPDAGLTLQVVLLFLLKLSLRMRLDRLDGVGDPVWADAAVVRHTVGGFRAALARKRSPSHLPDTPINCFDAFMDGCTESDLQQLLKAVIAAYPDRHPEKSLLLREFQAHAVILYREMAERLGRLNTPALR